MAAETTCRIFRFGVFEVNEAEAELRKHGIRIKLHAQPFQVLMLLLERSPGLVSREEIRARLWGQDTFVDFDHGLNTTVNKIRQALGDSASQPRFVETLPGKGYRFLMSVSQPAVDTPEPVTEAAALNIEAPVAVSVETFLAAPDELPAAPRKVVRMLLLLEQAMYLAFYVGALANLAEIHQILDEAGVFAPAALFSLLVITAAGLIPVRLFLCAAIAFDLQQLPAKFGRLFPALLPLDLLWALSPFLLIHHLDIGVALGMSAALLYMPFAQRSLIIMYARGR